MGNENIEGTPLPPLKKQVPEILENSGKDVEFGSAPSVSAKEGDVADAKEDIMELVRKEEYMKGKPKVELVDNEEESLADARAKIEKILGGK